MTNCEYLSNYLVCQVQYKHYFVLRTLQFNVEGDKLFSSSTRANYESDTVPIC